MVHAIVGLPGPQIISLWISIIDGHRPISRQWKMITPKGSIMQLDIKPTCSVSKSNNWSVKPGKLNPPAVATEILFFAFLALLAGSTFVFSASMGATVTNWAMLLEFAMRARIADRATVSHFPMLTTHAFSAQIFSIAVRAATASCALML